MRCGRGALRVCVVHVHDVLKWDSAGRGPRVMNRTCLALQFDIACGAVELEIRLSIADPRRTKQTEQIKTVTLIQNLSMAFSTLWPGSKFLFFFIMDPKMRSPPIQQSSCSKQNCSVTDQRQHPRNISGSEMLTAEFDPVQTSQD